MNDKATPRLPDMDLQDYIQRYQWFNLPEGIDQELLERMFYYKGAVDFFYEPAENKDYILPLEVKNER